MLNIRSTSRMLCPLLANIRHRKILAISLKASYAIDLYISYLDLNTTVKTHEEIETQAQTQRCNDGVEKVFGVVGKIPSNFEYLQSRQYESDKNDSSEPSKELRKEELPTLLIRIEDLRIRWGRAFLGLLMKGSCGIS